MSSRSIIFTTNIRKHRDSMKPTANFRTGTIVPAVALARPEVRLETNPVAVLLELDQLLPLADSRRERELAQATSVSSLSIERRAPRGFDRSWHGSFISRAATASPSMIRSAHAIAC